MTGTVVVFTKQSQVDPEGGQEAGCIVQGLFVSLDSMPESIFQGLSLDPGLTT